jgi:hypothetical protein
MCIPRLARETKHKYEDKAANMRQADIKGKAGKEERVVSPRVPSSSVTVQTRWLTSQGGE